MSARGALLGDRDEQPVRVLGVVARQRVAGVDPVLPAARDHALDRRRRASTANSRTTGWSWSSATPSIACRRSRA